MKRVRYIGDEERILPAIGVKVNKDDELDVPDTFENAFFITVTSDEIKKGDNE